MKAQYTSKVSCALFPIPTTPSFLPLSLELSSPHSSSHYAFPSRPPLSLQGFSVRIGAPKHVWWREGRGFSPGLHPKIPFHLGHTIRRRRRSWDERGPLSPQKKGGIFVRDPKDSFSMATTVYHHHYSLLSFPLLSFRHLLFGCRD